MNKTRTTRMYSILIFIMLIASVTIFPGCSADGEGNASVKVHNDTGRIILVYCNEKGEKDDNDTITSQS